MKRTATVVCIHEFGKPEDVVRVETWELPALRPQQVLVEVLAAPINPADLNLIEGAYGTRPSLPTVCGNEGVGIIAEIGTEVNGLSVGQHVIAPVRPGWWCTARVLDSADVVLISSDIPRELAAMMTVNPPTAFRMLNDFVPLRPGDWIIQNAANSVVGRSVIQVARQKGWRTLNVVRRQELISELQAEGADVVVTDEMPLSERIGELTEGADVRLGLNAVGGESARQIARSLGTNGTLVTYGAMSRQQLRIDNGLLIFKDIRCRGFWVSDWYRHAKRSQVDEMFGSLFPLAQAGKLKAPVEKTYSLTQVREAIAHSGRGGRSGKILLLSR